MRLVCGLRWEVVHPLSATLARSSEEEWLSYTQQVEISKFSGPTDERFEMLIKFYKGPKHNKREQVNDGSTGIIRVAKSWHLNPVYWEDGSQADPMQIPTCVTGTYVRTHHTHPDGSTFYVWQGWDRN